jgi:pyruvate/2-oxoacid:ferredoxin oxidoreductase alpha subunit
LPIELAIVDFLATKNQGVEVKKIEEVKSEVVAAEDKIVSEVKLGFGLEKIDSDWGKVLVAVKPYNHSVEAFLRAARPKSIKGNLLTLEVFYPFHKDKLEEPKNRKIVEAGLFECELSKSDVKTLIIKNDTPEAMVNGKLVEEKTKVAEGDMYDVAKEIFG